VSGATGAVLADAAVCALLRNGHRLEIVCSDYGELMWHHEMKERFRDATARWTRQGDITVHRPEDVAAPISSGSYPTSGMLIVPCSMATIGALASGAGTNLLHRAADVTIKEKRPLVLVPRETPLSTIHLRNMLTLAEAGAVVLPPEPAFYLDPQSIEDIVSALVDRMMQALGLIQAPAAHHRWA